MAEGKKIIARNRKAAHEYTLGERYEAGIVLTGSEIKSIRANKINLQDGFVQEQSGELWMHNVHISPYERSGTYGYVEPLRPRKLLLHRKEIAKILAQVRQKGFTIVPTEVYLKRGRAKVEIAMAKGKKLYDKRQTIAKRDSERELRQAMKEKFR